QGKLRATKQGRNWLTTKDWLLQYIESAEVYKNGLEEKRNGNETSSEVQKPMHVVRVLPVPPVNLPVAETIQQDDVVEELLPHPAPRFAFSKLGAVAFAIAIAIFVLGSGPHFLERDFSVFKSEQQIASLSESIQQLPVTLGKFFLQIASEARLRFSNIEDRFAQFKFAAEKKKGLVVVPSRHNDELVKEQIRASFSDEVSIFPHDDESGIITPIFRERIGNDYLYLLVPVNDEP
ncbi:hypothetical protein IIA94_02840, partial [Patescibacteria group bacterium]|nr:hypothetical protein [Patescibacteria group bacterium]